MKRILPVVAVLLCAVLLRSAYADNVSRLIDALSSDDYKERVSAVASLAKLGDARAIEPLIKSMCGGPPCGDSDADDESSVRQAAAVALSKLVTGDTDADLIQEAEDALNWTQKKDSASSVKKAAKKAYAKVKKIADSGGGGGDNSSSGNASGGIFVNMGSMDASIAGGTESTLEALMKKTVQKQFAKNASSMQLSPVPSKSQLKNMAAFDVSGTLNSLTQKDQGSDVIVTCKVHMQVATYPSLSLFAFLDSKASVQASNNASDIDGAKSDCVEAVVESLSAKIIPAIKAKAGTP
jgi:hypothetical protein